MPVRFRCVYCDQLLGIARRKAGTVVKCPNCAGQLIVPAPEGDDDPSDPDSPTAAADDAPPKKAPPPERTETAPAPAGDGGLLFERNDFDELLKPALEKKAPAVAVKPSRPSRPAPQPAPRHPSAPNAFDFTVAQASASEPVDVAPAAPMAPRVHVEPKRTGILLTPLKLILLSLFVIGGMACAFVGGLLLGWYLSK